MKKKPDPVGSSEIDTDETVAPSLEREHALLDEVSRLTAQLQAETAAHRRTEADKSLLSSIVESSEDSIVSITFDAVITSWNKGAEKLYGYPAAEVLGQPMMKLTLPEDLQEVLARIDKVKHHQSVELFTTTRVRRNGSRIWLSVQMSPVNDANGELIGISTIARDISAVKFAEEIARSIAQQTRHALDYAEATLRTAPVPLLVLEDDLRVHTANEAFYENFQVAPDESEGRLVYELGNGQWDIPKLRELLEEILPRNNPFKNFEVTHGFESIGHRTMLLSAQRMENEADQPQRIVMAIEDISERKRDEDSRATLAAVVESSDDAIISKNLDGIITSWNGGAERLFGYTAREAIGQPVMMLIPPELEDEEPGILDRIRHGEALGHHETVRCRKDRTRVDVSLTVSPVFDAHGRIVGASKVARDITERKQAEEALRASEERFRAAAGAVSDMIWTNNPGGEMKGEQSVWGVFTGQGQKDYDGHGWTDAVHPEDVQPTRDAWKLAVAENRTFEFEHRVRRHDGEWRLCSVLAVPVLDPKGGIREWVGVHTDITERKLAENALRESQQFTRRVLDNLFAFVGVLTVDGTLTDANRAPLEAAGIPAGEVLGKKFWDCYWWNYSAGIQAQLKDACERAASGEIVRYDVPVRMAGDTRMWIDFQVSPLRDTEGRITHLIPSGMDIEVRRAAEETLRASQDRFRAAVGAVSDIIWTNNSEGEMEGEQHDWGAFTGQLQEDYQDHGWAKAVHPEDAQPTADAWDLAVTEKRTFEFEHRVRRHDGEWRLCSIRSVPVLDHRGEIREWVGVHTDITERKLAERLTAKVNEELLISSLRLSESEERTRLATEATEVGIWEWNVHTDAIRWDAQMFRLYGIVPAEDGFVHYDDWKSAVLPEDLPENERILQETVRTFGRSRREFRIRRSEDGEVRDIEAVETVRTNEHGQVDWVLGTNLDVTERRRAQAALVAAKENAEAASRAKDEFLAALSHELRTPLTPVLIAAAALSTDPSLPAEARGQLDMMRRNIELEARLIDDLLDLTRIIHGKLNIAPVTTDIHELIHHADEIIRSDGLGKRLHLVLKLDATRHHALADPARIQQVFWNLLSNAVKFTPDGGTITVSSHNGAEGKIIIMVADNGIGIRAEVLANIFDAFEQGDTSGEHRYGGLGLGLAISSAIVNAHGGRIRAESEGRGHGAEFTVTLDSVPAPAARSGNDSPQGQPARSLSLLIVEDHEASRTVMEHLLTLSGHRVTTAATVHDALAAYKAAHFDAVISDLGLPDGSGIDLMVQIQSIRPVRAIALSGYGMERDLELTREAGFSAHLVKPVKVDQLKRLLSEMPDQGGQDSK